MDTFRTELGIFSFEFKMNHKWTATATAIIGNKLHKFIGDDISFSPMAVKTVKQLHLLFEYDIEIEEEIEEKINCIYLTWVDVIDSEDNIKISFILDEIIDIPSEDRTPEDFEKEVIVDLHNMEYSEGMFPELEEIFLDFLAKYDKYGKVCYEGNIYEKYRMKRGDCGIHKDLDKLLPVLKSIFNCQAVVIFEDGIGIFLKLKLNTKKAYEKITLKDSEEDPKISIGGFKVSDPLYSELRKWIDFNNPVEIYSIAGIHKCIARDEKKESNMSTYYVVFNY
jgi:hypothetical protein